MTNIEESVQDITLTGKSGKQYNGKIYTGRSENLLPTGKAIACLSNSVQNEEGWLHKVNAIYNTDDMNKELNHVENRDDISHLILIPLETTEAGVADPVDDLIRQYIHQ